LLGGAGLARLAIGQEASALDLEVRGPDGYGGPHFQRLSIRLALAGRPVLDDLDERSATSSGWELATASHNTVVVDSLNQRETPTEAFKSSAGSDFQFYAADPDFQVVSVDDPRAYPRTTSRYRHTVVVTANGRGRYALSVFEVRGGSQHDQIFHAAPGRSERWQLAAPTRRPPATLLPSALPYLESARTDQGRWFVQSYGEFRLIAEGELARPSLAGLVNPLADPGLKVASNSQEGGVAEDVVTLKLHLLGDTPMTAFTAISPDPTRGDPRTEHAGEENWRAGLILRRRSLKGATLNSVFVTLFEPTGKGFGRLQRVGRVASSADVVLIVVESEGVHEHLLVNLKPETTQRVQLPSGRYVSFDGLALRVRDQGLVLAGGTFAEGMGRLVSQARLGGTISQTVRKQTDRGRGWFLTPERLPDDPAIAGRTLIVRHGDGTCKAWTLDSIESTPQGTRLHVREEPGFEIEQKTGAARYYQFPQVTLPGPHQFRLAQIAR
jgi:hypothetical protein